VLARGSADAKETLGASNGCDGVDGELSVCDGASRRLLSSGGTDEVERASTCTKYDEVHVPCKQPKCTDLCMQGLLRDLQGIQLR
jgi:hypothetical protein